MEYQTFVIPISVIRYFKSLVEYNEEINELKDAIENFSKYINLSNEKDE